MDVPPPPPPAEPPPPPGLPPRAAIFRTSRGLATVVRVGLLAWCLVALLSIVSSVRQLDLVSRIERGDSTVTLIEIAQNDNRENAVNGVQGLFYLFAGVTWLVWQHRAQANLSALGAEGRQFSPGWAVGWWLIPLANLVQPVRTVGELWRASGPEGGATGWRSLALPSTVVVWWTLFVSGAVASVVSRVLTRGETLGAIRASSYLGIAGDALYIGAAIFAVTILGNIIRRQDLRRAAMA